MAHNDPRAACRGCDIVRDGGCGLSNTVRMLDVADLGGSTLNQESSFGLLWMVVLAWRDASVSGSHKR